MATVQIEQPHMSYQVHRRKNAEERNRIPQTEHETPPSTCGTRNQCAVMDPPAIEPLGLQILAWYRAIGNVTQVRKLSIIKQYASTQTPVTGCRDVDSTDSNVWKGLVVERIYNQRMCVDAQTGCTQPAGNQSSTCEQIRFHSCDHHEAPNCNINLKSAQVDLGCAGFLSCSQPRTIFRLSQNPFQRWCSLR